MKLRVKLKIILLLLVIYIPILFAQQPTLEWVRRYPDTANSYGDGKVIKIDNSGNIVVTGLVIINAVYNYGTIKYSSNGAQQWVRLFPGPGGRQTRSMAIDKNNNVYVTGYSYQPGHYFDYLTIKYDSSGNERWVRHYNGEANGLDDAYAIAADNDNNIYVTGLKSYGGISFVYCTIKYDTEGNILWQRDYGPPSQGTEPHAISIDNNSNTYITGRHNNKATTISYDSLGNLRWAQTYPYAIANDLALDNEANVFITGICEIVTVKQFFSIKYTSTGELLWVKNYRNCDTLGCFNEAHNIVVDKANNIIISGKSGNGMSGNYVIVTIKYTNYGDSVWGSIIKPNNGSTFWSVNGEMVTDTQDNIYLCKTSQDTGIYNKGSYFTYKYDSTGALIWEKAYGFNLNYGASAYSLAVDQSNNVYVTGIAPEEVFNQINMTTIKYSQPIGIINTSGNVPFLYMLKQNYPNPFNTTTKIGFEITKTGFVNLTVYNVLGKEITKLVNENLEPGSYEVFFDAIDYSSGLYFYSISVNEFIETKKMVLVK